MKRTLAAGLMIAAAVTPASAQDTAEKVGIAAALGLTAGTGKTTLGDGAGGIEAALLGSGALDEAGRIIAGVTRSYAAGRPVMVVSRTEQTDMITARVVGKRIAALKTSLEGAIRSATARTAAINRAKNEAERAGKSGQERNSTELEKFVRSLQNLTTSETTTAAAPPSPKNKLTLTDIPAALATDVTIASIPLPLDDRLLVQSVVMNTDATALPVSADWITRSEAVAKPNQDIARFVLPAEIAFAKEGGVLKNYEALTALADNQRGNGDTEVKALISSIDAYLKDASTPPEGGGASPLGLAIQMDAIGLDKAPYLLRVATEQAGGTSTVRGNVWFTLGFPGAATVGSGLLASFRLIDPSTGRAEVAGLIRCAVRRVSIRSIDKMIRRDSSAQPRAICTYRAIGTPSARR